MATWVDTGTSKAPSCSTAAWSLYDHEQRIVFGAYTFR